MRVRTGRTTSPRTIRPDRIIGSTALAAAIITTGLGIAVGTSVLLAPTQVRCELPALQPGTGATGFGNCRHMSILEAGESLWPLPLIPVALWSLAPVLGLIGVLRMLVGRRGLVIVGAALALEATATVSFVAGPMFFLYVLLPLALTTVLAMAAAAAARKRNVVDGP